MLTISKNSAIINKSIMKIAILVMKTDKMIINHEGLPNGRFFVVFLFLTGNHAMFFCHNNNRSVWMHTRV